MSVYLLLCHKLILIDLDCWHICSQCDVISLNISIISIYIDIVTEDNNFQNNGIFIYYQLYLYDKYQSYLRYQSIQIYCGLFFSLNKT